VKSGTRLALNYFKHSRAAGQKSEIRCPKSVKQFLKILLVKVGEWSDILNQKSPMAN
jgi:hypothetical protein